MQHCETIVVDGLTGVKWHFSDSPRRQRLLRGPCDVSAPLTLCAARVHVHTHRRVHKVERRGGCS